MDRVLELARLLDFYGATLTERQRTFAEAYAYDNLSLYEIAEQEGVSRQAVRDGIVHAEEHMKELEQSVHMISRSDRIFEHVLKATEALKKSDNGTVLDELNAMKDILEDNDGI